MVIGGDDGVVIVRANDLLVHGQVDVLLCFGGADFLLPCELGCCVSYVAAAGCAYWAVGFWVEEGCR